MPSKKPQPNHYGTRLPLGHLDGETITRKMLKNQQKASQKILEFLRFCEDLNRGQL